MQIIQKSKRQTMSTYTDIFYILLHIWDPFPHSNCISSCQKSMISYAFHNKGHLKTQYDFSL